jgi:hypothetical protein
MANWQTAGLAGWRLGIWQSVRLPKCQTARLADCGQDCETDKVPHWQTVGLADCRTGRLPHCQAARRTTVLAVWQVDNMPSGRLTDCHNCWTGRGLPDPQPPRLPGCQTDCHARLPDSETAGLPGLRARPAGWRLAAGRPQDLQSAGLADCRTGRLPDWRTGGLPDTARLPA